MGLADRYNRGDGRLESLDRYLTHIGDRVGTAWWVHTGIRRTSFTQGLYVVSIWAAIQQFTLSMDPMVLMIAGVALLNWQGKGTHSRGGLVEQIQSEAAGLPKNTLIVLRLIILGLGSLQIALAAGDVLSTLLGADMITRLTVQQALVGSALVSLQASDYIRRTNPFTPRGGGLRQTP